MVDDVEIFAKSAERQLEAHLRETSASCLYVSKVVPLCHPFVLTSYIIQLFIIINICIKFHIYYRLLIVRQLSLNVDRVPLGPTLDDSGLSKWVKVADTAG